MAAAAGAKDVDPALFSIAGVVRAASDVVAVASDPAGVAAFERALRPRK